MKIELEGKVYDLDIDQAKKLNLLKEENAKCKSWKEYCNKYLHKEGFYYDDVNENILSVDYPCAANEQLTKEEAVAISAFSKLLKLRRDWIGTWEPDWCGSERNYCVIITGNHCTTHYFYSDRHTFSFPTEEMTQEFLGCFENLFNQCKNII